MNRINRPCHNHLFEHSKEFLQEWHLLPIIKKTDIILNLNK